MGDQSKRAFGLTQDMRWCCQTQGRPRLVLHRIEMSEGSASTRTHISGAANLHSSRAMEATKPLVIVMAPPHHKDVPTLAKGGRGHITGVLKGCGEPCWQAKDWHTRGILQPQQSEVLLHSHVRPGLTSHGYSQPASIPNTAWGSTLLFYNIFVYKFPWDGVCKSESTIFYKINWALSCLHGKYENIITALLGREC